MKDFGPYFPKEEGETRRNDKKKTSPRYKHLKRESHGGKLAIKEIYDKTVGECYRNHGRKNSNQGGGTLRGATRKKRLHPDKKTKEPIMRGKGNLPPKRVK